MSDRSIQAMKRAKRAEIDAVKRKLAAQSPATEGSKRPKAPKRKAPAGTSGKATSPGKTKRAKRRGPRSEPKQRVGPSLPRKERTRVATILLKHARKTKDWLPVSKAIWLLDSLQDT